MTVDTEPQGSRRGLLAAVIAVAAAVAAAVAIVRLRRQEGLHINMSITIDRPVGEVFAFVSDARNVLEWLPAAVERRKVTEGPIGVGTRFEATDRFGERRIDHTQEVVGFEKDRLVRSRISAPWDGTYDIRVEPSDGGTLLTVDTTAQPSGWFRLFRLVPASMMRQQFEQDYARLKDLLEGRAEPAATHDDGFAAEADSGKTAATITIEPESESVGPVPEETVTT